MGPPVLGTGHSSVGEPNEFHLLLLLPAACGLQQPALATVVEQPSEATFASAPPADFVPVAPEFTGEMSVQDVPPEAVQPEELQAAQAEPGAAEPQAEAEALAAQASGAVTKEDSGPPETYAAAPKAVPYRHTAARAEVQGGGCYS